MVRSDVQAKRFSFRELHDFQQVAAMVQQAGFNLFHAHLSKESDSEEEDTWYVQNMRPFNLLRLRVSFTLFA